MTHAERTQKLVELANGLQLVESFYGWTSTESGLIINREGCFRPFATTTTTVANLTSSNCIPLFAAVCLVKLKLGETLITVTNPVKVSILGRPQTVDTQINILLRHFFTLVDIPVLPRYKIRLNLLNFFNPPG